jgi:peptidoglycan hydrolase-like protein with peptidoglycan-binding domain
MKRKNIIIIIVILLAVLALAGGLYFFFIRDSGNGGGGGFSIRDFLPFGRSPGVDERPTEPAPTPPNQGDGTSQLPAGIIPDLRQISVNPTAGAVSFRTSDGVLVIRLVDRATGHVFETTDVTLALQRISNTTIPKVHEAVWSNKNSVVLRHLMEDGEIIESIVLRLLEPGETVETSEPDAPFKFEKELKEGDQGIDVLNLQKVLNKEEDTKITDTGPGSPGQETMLFGPATSAALKKFQEKYKEEILTPQDLEESTGIVDTLTREKLNEITGVREEGADLVEPSSEGGELSLLETTLIFLSPDIKSLTTLREADKIFFLQEDALGSVGFTTNSNGSQKTQVFDSGAKEWLAKDVSGDTVMLFTKSSFDFEGVVLLLNTETKRVQRVIGGIKGLTVLSDPEGNRLIFSESERNGLSVKSYDRSSGQINDLNLKTLPEKCVWSRDEVDFIFCALPINLPAGDYPDSWYRGEVSFTDTLWKINVQTGNMTPLNDESFITRNIDAINLFLDESEQYLFFFNKKDHSLWSLKLFEEFIGEELIEVEDEEEATPPPEIPEN